MSDLAQEHWQNLEKHRPNDLALVDYDKFLDTFAAQFDLADPEADARAEYGTLTMENDKRFTTYVVAFEGVAQRTGFNEAHWMTRLEDSVPDRITNAAQFAPPPLTFEEMKNLFTSIDNRYWKERHRKEAYKKQLQQLERRAPNTTRTTRRPDGRFTPNQASNTTPTSSNTPPRHANSPMPAPTPAPAETCAISVEGLVAVASTFWEEDEEELGPGTVRAADMQPPPATPLPSTPGVM